MPGQHHAANISGADGSEQVGLGAFRVMEQFAVHALFGQIVADEADQLQVGVAADRGIADQPGQQGAAGELTHHPAPHSSVQSSG
ncbi:hypothetical protein D3C75_1262410 [compost metagenome]